MTHKDIYTKFMIEYDKANVTSSYPSLTEYEIATILDKAYNALIALKVTGNNIRRVPLEGDLKSISDLQPLICRKTKGCSKIEDTNVYNASLPADYLYFVSANLLEKNSHKTATIKDEQLSIKTVNDIAIDLISNRKLPIKLMNHQISDNFIVSSSNIPWIKTPVCYIENNQLFVICDPWSDIVSTPYYTYEYRETVGNNQTTDRRFTDSRPNVTLKQGTIYTEDDISSIFNDNTLLEYFAERHLKEGDIIGIDVEIDSVDEVFFHTYYFIVRINYKYPIDIVYIKSPKKFLNNISEATEFECNDTVAEELISLAIAFALDNVESTRLNNKLNMRGLEA